MKFFLFFFRNLIPYRYKVVQINHYYQIWDRYLWQWVGFKLSQEDFVNYPTIYADFWNANEVADHLNLTWRGLDADFI